MLDLLWPLLVAIIKAIGLSLALYLFYWKVIDYFRAVHFYKSQGDKACKIIWGHLPIFGHTALMLWSMWKSYTENDNYFLLKHGFDYGTRDAKTAMAFFTKEAGLAIGDVKVVESMYTVKNKYFDKHPLIKDLALCLTGESILFNETSDDWRKSRKAISPAFYKGKLENLVEIAKEAVATTLDRFKAIASNGPKSEVDIMDEVGLMTARIILMCSFGVDCAEAPVDFWENGKRGTVTLAHSLRCTFGNLINRMSSPHIILFPFLAEYHITPFERDQQRNAIALRQFC